MKSAIVVFVLILLVILGANYIEEQACNKKGSIAEKINWAGHNCKK